MRFDICTACQKVWHKHLDESYLDMIKSKYGRRLITLDEYTDDIANHFTSFFRKKTLLEQAFSQEFISTQFGNKKIEILSVWCSYGQEVYVIAHYLSKFLRNYNILGIDFSKKCINHAKRWIFRWESHDKEKTIKTFKDFFWDNVIFDSQNSTIEFRDHIKSKICFDTQDAIVFNPKLEDKFDIIICYNMVLHLTPQSAKNVSDNIYSYAKKWSVILVDHWPLFQKTLWLKYKNYRDIAFLEKNI
mgnify:CR=1 FL=1